MGLGSEQLAPPVQRKRNVFMSSTRTTSPRIAIVTGASGGIGRATAERLAADGMTVVVHFAGNRSRAEETVATINSAGGQAVSMPGDVADEAEMAELFARTEELYGGVDVVVNTAGIMRL